MDSNTYIIMYRSGAQAWWSEAKGKDNMCFMIGES